MSLLNKFGIDSTPVDISEVDSNPLARFKRMGGYQPAVGDSQDLRRVVGLPRRPSMLGTPELAAITADLMARLGKGPVQCDCLRQFKRPCAKSLLPVQAWALHEISTVGGLAGPIGVGHGKTLLGLLAPLVIPDCKVAVLLLPPNLREQLKVDWEFYGKHFHLPNLAGGRWFIPGRPMLHVVGYSELSGAKNTDLLTRIAPDVIICDEAHNLRRRDAARTKRFLRHFQAVPATRLCAWSGTLTAKSLRDYAHLMALALRENAPVPVHPPTVEEWAGALDPSPINFPAPPGSLAQLCDPGEAVKDGFRRRLVETRGVVTSADVEACNASLYFHERHASMPPELEAMRKTVVREWARPDGEEFTTVLDVVRCAQQLAAGFYYRHKFPRGEPVGVIKRWFEARKAWHREVRDRLKHSRPHMDSPLLLAKAAIRFSEGYKGELPVWDSEAWPEWRDIRNTVKPVQETVWVDDFLVQDAARWARDNAGIVWYEYTALGRAIAKAAGVPLYGSASETPGADEAIIQEDGSRAVVASLLAHGTGKNLIAFNTQLIANVPSDGGRFEQLLGRTHRNGQQADEINVHVYRHVPELCESLDKARTLADHIAGTFGGSQKLIRASYLWE